MTFEKAIRKPARWYCAHCEKFVDSFVHSQRHMNTAVQYVPINVVLAEHKKDIEELQGDLDAMRDKELLMNKQLQQEIRQILEDYRKYKDNVFLDVPSDEPPTFMSGAYCNCARWLERKFEAFLNKEKRLEP